MTNNEARDAARLRIVNSEISPEAKFDEAWNGAIDEFVRRVKEKVPVLDTMVIDEAEAVAAEMKEK